MCEKLYTFPVQSGNEFHTLGLIYKTASYLCDTESCWKIFTKALEFLVMPRLALVPTKQSLCLYIFKAMVNVRKSINFNIFSSPKQWTSMGKKLLVHNNSICHFL